jgi:putative ABC transport system substrate-binding protein
MVGDVRSDPVAGLKDGLKERGYVEGRDVKYEVRNAGGKRSDLGRLAQEIVSSRPDVAIASGGIEADALKAATTGTTLPVVFLGVASAVDRALVDSLQRPGGNLTGVDTNDTDLTAKRLWFIRKMFPDAKRILIPVIPTIVAAVKTVEVARAEAPALKMEIQTLEGKDKEAIAARARQMKPGDSDVIYIGMAAPVWQIEKQVFFPISMALKVPIMGINRGDIKRGALAAYACSRYDTGKQAARLVEKIFKGAAPSAIPVETPTHLEFVINRWVADRMGISLPRKIWRLADEVVNLPIE